MAITRVKKQEILTNLKTIFKDSSTVVFVNFHGLTVSDVSVLRKDLKQSDVNYLVVKKSLVKKALEGDKVTGDFPELKGELSLAYSKDQLEPARKVFSFQKKLGDKLSILGGMFDGRFVNCQEMTEIAQIPSRETLYAQFVNIINSPIQGLVIGLSKIAEKKSV